MQLVLVAARIDASTRRAACLLATLLAGACQTPTSAPLSAEATTGPFVRRSDLEAALERARATNEVDALWQRIRAAGTMPIAFDDTAYFFYRGPGEDVRWLGDHTDWQRGWNGRGVRVGETDLWRYTASLMPASRLDYKIVVDGDWRLDPNNPHTMVGGFGPNSEARMPGWRASPFVTRGPSTPRGRFTDDLALDSRHLGYAVRFRVYLPPGLPDDAKELPTLFVTDGSDYWRDEMGAMVIVLDRLYEEKKIAPIAVVFVDPWNDDRSKNRRRDELIPKSPTECPYCDFIVDELIPTVGRTYPTTTDPKKRGILGTSLGGLHATHMGLTYGDAFDLIGIQSAAYQVPEALHVHERLMAAEQFPSKVFLNVGLYEVRFVWHSDRAAEKLKALGVDLVYVQAPEGHSWGHWRAFLDEALIHFFGVKAE